MVGVVILVFGWGWYLDGVGLFFGRQDASEMGLKIRMKIRIAGSTLRMYVQ